MTPGAPFSELAATAFEFLEQQGFSLVSTEEGCVQYQSDRVFLAIEWERRSGELDVRVGLRTESDRPADLFSLSEILCMGDVDVSERSMRFRVGDEARLRPFIEALARDLRVHAQAAIAGDRMFFHRLTAFRDRESRRLTLETELSRIRSEVAQAWRR